MIKRLAIICFTNYTTEPRVLRTIEALKGEYDLTLFSASDTLDGIVCKNISSLNEDSPEISLYRTKPFYLRRVFIYLLKLFGYSFQSKRYFERQYWSPQRKNLFKRIKAGRFDLVIGHGIFTLPILACLGTKTVFNAHEYYLKEFEENENWRRFTQPYYQFILDCYLSKVDCMFCVSKQIEKEYQLNYNIPSIEVNNATAFFDLAPSKVGQVIQIIHHGGAIRTRQLELMAEMMDYLGENYFLTFMLTPSDTEYLEELKKRCQDKKNIHFIEPVKVDRIAETCNQYDIGLFILPPVNFNWYYALPNKLFEFIQGRLCIAVSPNPDMMRVVSENDLGIISGDFTPVGMAKKIAELTPEKIAYYKEQSNKCALVLNANTTNQAIRERVNSLLS